MDELETERRRLEALVESSPVGVMVVDAATRTFASVNREAERILGMSPEPGSTLVRYHEVAIYRRTDGKQQYEEPANVRWLECPGSRGGRPNRRNTVRPPRRADSNDARQRDADLLGRRQR